MRPEEGFSRLRGLGFGEASAHALWGHFDDAEQRGKLGHGYSRIPWLESQAGGFDFHPIPVPRNAEESPGFERWDGDGAIGHLLLEAFARHTLEAPPERARPRGCRRALPPGGARPHPPPPS